MLRPVVNKNTSFFLVFTLLSARRAVDFDGVVEAVNKGFSLIFNRLNYRWGSVAGITRAVSAVMGHAIVNANLYLTPAGAQGFNRHFDEMDVIVLQLHGSKEWHVYEPLVTLPAPHQVYKPAAAEATALALNTTLNRSARAGWLFFFFALVVEGWGCVWIRGLAFLGGWLPHVPTHHDPFARWLADTPLPPSHPSFPSSRGDLLYLPRGWIHEAHTPLTTNSLHLTIGIDFFHMTYADFITHMLGSFRKPLFS